MNFIIYIVVRLHNGNKDCFLCFFHVSSVLSEVTVMSELDKTMSFSFDDNESKNVKDTLENVYQALEEKGYNPINQIVGYLLSGDPAYIPRHNDARNLILKHERDEIIEELVRNYLNKER